ncbi:MAG: ATP-dependent helicase, partial [Ureaplasma sp.]|nr:ATP-dependent helicase [Ureaplasma sp.]
NNIFAVGDGDQTIYSFRGANPNIINNFIELVPNNKVIVLKQNYRSTQSILNASNSLIDKNRNRVKKSLVSNNGDGNKPTLFEAASDFAEAKWVCKNILDLKKDKDVKLSQIAILLRSNYLTRIFEQELVSQNIEYRIFGGLKFYQRAEIKDLISYLQAIENNDELALLRILNVPSRKIGGTSEQAIIDYSKENNITFFEALLEYENLPITTTAKKSISDFLNLMYDFKNYQYENIVDLLDYVIEKINYKEYYEKKDESRKHIIKENIDELRRAINIFQANNEESKLIDYLQNVSLFTDKENEEVSKQEDYVSVMTVHNSKGLEFDYVFLVAFNEGIFPSNMSIKDGEIEEERRVAYVALTRARKELFISYHNGQDFLTKQPKLPSQFIKDIGKENLNVVKLIPRKVSNYDMEWFDSNKKRKEVIQENYNKEKINDYKIGDLVSHIVYGAGSIIGIEGNLLVIRFSKKDGIKRILFNHNSIKRMFN